KAIRLGGTNAYVTFGAATALGSKTFTLETWFRRDGAGIATFTGTGGVTAVPLVTKGMAEVDNNNSKDMNYFLGIRGTDNVLDAARIWNYARSPQQISRGRMFEIPSATPGLLGRWGLNEGAGSTAADSSAGHVNGVVIGTNYTWVDGAPFAGARNTSPTAVDD